MLRFAPSFRAAKAHLVLPSSAPTTFTCNADSAAAAVIAGDKVLHWRLAPIYPHCLGGFQYTVTLEGRRVTRNVSGGVCPVLTCSETLKKEKLIVCSGGGASARHGLREKFERQPNFGPRLT